MNKMKVLLFSTVGILIAAVVVVILLNVARSDIRTQVPNPQSSSAFEQSGNPEVEIKDQLVLMEVFRNGGKIHDLKGAFVDKDGKRYPFDLAGTSLSISDDEVYAKAYAGFAKLEGSDFILPGNMKLIYSQLSQVNEKAAFNTAGEEGRNGSTTVYALIYQDSETPRLMKIGTFGDQVEIPTDSSAESIYSFYTKAYSALSEYKES